MNSYYSVLIIKEGGQGLELSFRQNRKAFRLSQRTNGMPFCFEISRSAVMAVWFRAGGEWRVIDTAGYYPAFYWGGIPVYQR